VFGTGQRLAYSMELLSCIGDSFQSRLSLSEVFFRFGTLKARLRTNDAEFKVRFLRIFHDCLEALEVPSDAPIVNLNVNSPSARDPVTAEISGHDGRCAGAVLSQLFPELELKPADYNAVDGWRFYARSRNLRRPVVATGGNHLVLDRELPWQMIVANYFIDRVLYLQSEVGFFHGATLAVGNRGVLLSGNKGAGKSTLSLALAARGHGFFSDEIAAIHSRTSAVSPFPRAVSIRTGPQAKAVERFLGQNQLDRETLPDGTDRLRVSVSQIFPDAISRSVRLTHAFFLNGISDRPRATAFDFSWKDLALPAPLHATTSGKSAGERTILLLKLFGQAQCYILTPGGTPDQTAELIENIVES